LSDAAEGWHELYITLGGSAAALTGLLFVAVSLHAAYFANPRFDHVRAAAEHALMSYLAILAISICMLIPRQDRPWLGAELTLLGLASLVWLWLFGGRVRRRVDFQRGPTPGEWQVIFISSGICSVGLLVAGLATATTGAAWPLYLLPVIAFLLLTSGVWISLQLVLRVPDNL